MPADYQIEKSNDEYNILTATKYSGEEVSAMIEIRYSDDWSFATFTNDEYISENDIVRKTLMSFIFNNKNMVYLGIVIMIISFLLYMINL